MNNHPRVLFISNSQGTAAGLTGEARYSNYPLLIEDQSPDIDCRFWLTSDLSVATVSRLYREVVMQHRPDIVILQCGIIEAALRILPVRLREILRILPGGSQLTGFLHKNRKRWFTFLSHFQIQFVDIKLTQFEHYLKDIHSLCAQDRIKLYFMEIPLLAEKFENEVLFGNNVILSKYNDSLKRIASELKIRTVDPFEGNLDVTRNSLYLPESVHFSLKGHALIAANISRYLLSKEKE